MESLLCDRIKVLQVIDNIEDELQYIKKELKKVQIIEEISEIQNVQEDTTYPEKNEIVINKQEKVKTNQHKEISDTGYMDYYDMNSRPEFHI